MKTLQKIYEESNEVQQAYFDCWIEDEEWDKLEPYRDLDWKSETFYTVEEAFKLFASAVPGYNAFSPDLINRISELFLNPKVAPAREGSVCVYIKGKPKVSFGIIRDALSADECDDYAGETRVWWD